MKSIKKLLRLPVIGSSVVAVGALVLFAGIAPASSAAPLPHAKTLTVTSHLTKVPLLRGVDGPTSITCTAKANNPHDSHHVGGTVNFVGSVSCTAPVISLKMTLSLYWDGYVQATKPKSNFGFASISNNVAAACTSGGWQGTTYATVTFPPGYTPQSGVVSQSNIKSITC